MRRTLTSLLLFPLLLLHSCGGQEVASAAPQPADSHVLNRRLHNMAVAHGHGKQNRGAIAKRTYFCNLESAPVTQVAMNETIGKVYQYQTNNNDTTTTTQTHSVKACECYWGLNSTSYCPADSNYCHISVSRNTKYVSVACFRDTKLKSFARSIFTYWCIVMAFLFIFLIWSGTGRQFIRHIRSRRNPDVNERYVDEQLRMEIYSERQRFFQWRDSFIAEGNCVGLKFKTKIYHVKAREDKHHEEGVDTCSICILELKDRDRIADLSCNHYFHADCLSEWIKKKNSCPLCQEEGIAKEVRSYDIELGPNAETIQNADELNGLSTGND